MNKKIFSFKISFITVATSISLNTVIASPAPKYSKVEVALKDSALTLKVIPETGHILTFEGPWNLKIDSLQGATTSKNVLKKDALDQTTGTFTLELKKLESKWNGAYKLTSFVCTIDKTRCYREVHTGNLNGG